MDNRSDCRLKDIRIRNVAKGNGIHIQSFSLSLIGRTPYDGFAAVLVIDESTRRGLGKSNMLVLLRKLQAMQYPLNCYIDIVPTGTLILT